MTWVLLALVALVALVVLVVLKELEVQLCRLEELVEEQMMLWDHYQNLKWVEFTMMVK